MKTIIIVSPDQYGYFTIYYNYTKYLTRDGKVIYVCFDQGEKKFEETKNLRVEYIAPGGSKILRTIKYYRTIVSAFNSNVPARVILKYYFFSSLLNLFIPRKDLILDIRTGYISKTKIKTFFFNSIIRAESLLFKRIITLSESLKKKLKLQSSKTTIIPLGAELINSSSKSFDELVLLYVGTITSRNISDTVEGLAQFINTGRRNIDIKYYIVGGGKPSDVKKLIEIIQNFKMQEIVQYKGPVYGEDLLWFFKSCNVGISYIPMIRDYDCQPATKTIEYMLAGMPVIATNTYENRLIVNKTNGVLINDSPEDFCIGLMSIYKQRNSFNSSEIRKSVESYTWENIVNTNLKPFLQKLIK